MTNIDQTIPRKIITALIVSDDFAQGYFNIQKDNLLFDEIGLRIIEEWCSKFYSKYINCKDCVPSFLWTNCNDTSFHVNLSNIH